MTRCFFSARLRTSWTRCASISSAAEVQPALNPSMSYAGRDGLEVPLKAPTPRLSATLAVITIAVMIVLAMLAAAPASARSSDPAARAASDKLVDSAEALILQAGKSDPVDSALIDQGIAKLRQALRVDPDNDSAYIDLGFCY